MVAGVNRDAGNIFKNTHSELSRIHSTSGGSSEASMRALSSKDIQSVTSIQKDVVEYEFDKGLADQKEDWRDENFERSFGGLFQ